ncbi:discoidin domain-containing protein [Chthonomonas calidirosea]|uniref:discoidin domain-containing protein n=1 Tax=Chthonomonas calidirosea TaxID=454171 RepID=UPI0006EC4ACB|nr:discoidin domain-containing protein [Chthonomonas calidirosea]CEK16925.1 hypothetical protein CP488_01677 [Chthonomonas calidirosea]
MPNPQTYSDPYPLSATAIAGLTTPINAWMAKVHRQSRFGMTTAELWFYKDGSWIASPAPVLMTASNHPVLRRRLREPATLEATLLDPQGLLAPTNVGSIYNQGINGFEPLVIEARPILFRVGTWCYNDLALGLMANAMIWNAPPSPQQYAMHWTAVPASGQLSYLTDGVFTPWNATSNPNQHAVTFSLNANQVLTLTFDLGSVKMVHHIAARFGTGGLTGCTLPASLTVAFSNDNVHWVSMPARPVGGPKGDWDEAYLNDATDPNVTEVFICDVEQNARYVQLQMVAYQNQTIGLDEVGIFGGMAGQWLGMNRFCGYLGDSMAYDAEGYFTFSATDVLKRLADNNETRLTAPFGNVDVADIAYALLTGAGYWPGAMGAYDGPWIGSQIGWQSGVGLTGLIMPIWQGQGNNHLGYQYELWHEVGWIFEADGNGVLQVREPPYRQMRPDRVLISAPDGNEDVRHVVRTGTGKELRNAVSITTGKVSAGQLGVTVQLYDPASVAAFGHRRLIVTDPLLITPDLQTKMGAAILRDYAWRLWRLHCEISPDYDTKIHSIHAFRTTLRPALSAKTQAGVTVQELWSLEAIEEHFMPGEWWGLAEYAPYVPSALPPPTITSLDSSSTSPYALTIRWQSYTGQPGVVGFRVYYSTASSSGPFTLANGSSPAPVGATAYTFGSFNGGQQVWAYVTTLDINGHESVPSVVYSALAGGAPMQQSGWVVTDLSPAGQTSVATTQGGVSGTTYEFAFLFSSPPAGLRGFFFTYAVGSIPNNQDDFRSWVHAVGSDVGHINVPAGQRGSSQNEFAPPWVAGPLTWYQRLFVPGGIASGTKIYWRLWSWYNGQWLGSNIVDWQF